MIHVDIIPVLSDNYVHLVHDEETDQTLIVDPAVADEVIEVVESKGLSVDYILNTHHHGDHVGGNKKIKEHFGCQIIGYVHDAHRIPGIDWKVDDGQEIELCGQTVRVLFTPGHTLGHIVYFFDRDHVLFVGDTVFSMGCGRLFEGEPTQMYQSLERIKSLPSDTLIYCAHEYTSANGAFALTVEPDNQDLHQRMQEVSVLRSQNQPTLPVPLGVECLTNPFLRSDSDAIRKNLAMQDALPEEVFAEVRKRKDNF